MLRQSNIAELVSKKKLPASPCKSAWAQSHISAIRVRTPAMPRQHHQLYIAQHLSGWPFLVLHHQAKCPCCR